MIVDDEPRIADTLAVIFQRAGYATRVAYSGEDALSCLAAYQPSLVITDVVMPGMDGIELARAVRSSCPNSKVLLFSGNADTQQMLNAAREQGHTFEVLAKPIPPVQMLAKIASLLS